jgi:hypothetical protein
MSFSKQSTKPREKSKGTAETPLPFHLYIGERYRWGVALLHCPFRGSSSKSAENGGLPLALP